MKISGLIKVVLLSFVLSACNHLRIYPEYSEVSLQHRSSVKIYDDNNTFQKQWIMNPQKYKLMLVQKEQIEQYIQSAENISQERKDALRNLTLKVGMTGQDIAVLIGPPSKITDKNRDIETWVYKEKDVSPKYYWFYDWAKLHFKSGILADIETKHINIHEPLGY